MTTPIALILHFDVGIPPERISTFDFDSSRAHRLPRLFLGDWAKKEHVVGGVAEASSLDSDFGRFTAFRSFGFSALGRECRKIPLPRTLFWAGAFIDAAFAKVVQFSSLVVH